MGAFDKVRKGRKSKPEKEGAAKSPAPRKKNDLMSAVLRESVVETVMEDFGSNVQFAVSRNGEQVYVGLYLNTADIGGLNKKSAKDEAKGSIIEAISSGRMATLITPDLMADECIIFVPNSLTVDAMSEYELLGDAPYKLALVHRDGDFEVTDAQVTLKQVEDLIVLNGDVHDLLGEGVQTDDGAGGGFDPGDDEDLDGIPVFDGADEEPPPPEPPPAVDDSPEADLFGEDGGDVGSYDPSYTGADGAYGDGDGDGDYGDGPDDGEDGLIEVDDETVRKAVARRFYSTDLGLEVSTEAFDQHFMQGDEFIPFPVDRGEGWLNEYLSQMSQDANTELKRMHRDNLLQAREQFLLLVQAHCEQIIKDLDITDGGTEYGQVYQSLMDTRDELGTESARKAAEEQERLRKDWENKLREVGDSAADRARQEYRDRYGRQHEDDMARIPLSIRTKMEGEIEDQIRTMHDLRREEAAKRLDLGINEAILQVSRAYMEMLDQEEARYKEWQGDMAKFVDDNRRSEIARVETLGEDLRQREKSDSITAEFTDRIKTITAEAENRRAALVGDMQEMEAKHAAKLREMESEYGKNVASLREANAALQSQIETLLKQVGNMDAAKEKEYEGRVKSLKLEVEAANERYNNAMGMQRKSNFIVGLLCAVAIAAAIAVGFIVGTLTNVRSESSRNQANVVDSFNQKMDEMQFMAKYPEIYQAWLEAQQSAGVGTAAPER